MSIEGLNFSEGNQTTEKQDFSAINISHILTQSEAIKRIKQKEYADNVDNKVTIPSDLTDEFEGIFPEEDVIIEGSEKNNKFDEFKKELYLKFGLSEILEENSDLQKFEKGLIDGGFLDNIEMLGDLASVSLEEIIGMIKQLSNWETIKAILIDLYDSIEDITKVFSDPYAGGIALGALGIGPVSKGLKGIKVAEKLGRIKENNLFESKKYDLKSDETLDEILKRIDENDIIGEGENAIIINHPENDNLVIKIAKEGMYVDDIIKEYNTHLEFRKIYKLGLVEGKIDSNVIIPKVDKPLNSTGGYFFIEKIQGQNLFTKYHLDLYKDKELSKYDFKELENLTDNQFLQILKKEKLPYAIPSMNLGDVGMWGGGSTLQVNMMLYTSKFQKENMKKTIDFFEQNGLIHTDFHAGNIMVDKNKNNFIIDFGNTNK